MTKVIDGKALSTAVKDALKVRIGIDAARYGRTPCLAVIIVGENPASQVYVRNKIRAAQYVGMQSRLIAMAADVSQEELLTQIAELNDEQAVDGVLVQLPLPKHIDEQAVISAIAPEKDVDGFHILNAGALWTNGPCLQPCTPKGIMELIRSTGVSIRGANAVIVGRSNIVGKPVAKLLLDEDATVTIAHSRTADLAAVTRNADILVVAVGRPGIVTGEMVKEGAVVIDVGINRLEDGSLAGDVNFASASKRAGWITPVPGGVGPMTIAMLMSNCYECYLRRM